MEKEFYDDMKEIGAEKEFYDDMKDLFNNDYELYLEKFYECLEDLYLEKFYGC